MRAFCLKPALPLSTSACSWTARYRPGTARTNASGLPIRLARLGRDSVALAPTSGIVRRNARFHHFGQGHDRRCTRTDAKWQYAKHRIFSLFPELKRLGSNKGGSHLPKAPAQARVGLPTASSERNASCRLGVPCDIFRRTNHRRESGAVTCVGRITGRGSAPTIVDPTAEQRIYLRGCSSASSPKEAGQEK
jgi:hypothetical protein